MVSGLSGPGLSAPEWGNMGRHDVWFFLAGIINAIVNKQAVASHLRGNVLAANALAATWGFATPLCCCSGIPTALTLYRSGSRRGPACAFLIAVPWFSWYLGKASVIGLFAAVAAAVVFYTDSLATLPWVRTLLDKGLGVGSGMVLLVAGVGTNVSTLRPIARTMGAPPQRLLPVTRPCVLERGDAVNQCAEEVEDDRIVPHPVLRARDSYCCQEFLT